MWCILLRFLVSHIGTLGNLSKSLSTVRPWSQSTQFKDLCFPVPSLLNIRFADFKISLFPPHPLDDEQTTLVLITDQTSYQIHQLSMFVSDHSKTKSGSMLGCILYNHFIPDLDEIWVFLSPLLYPPECAPTLPSPEIDTPIKSLNSINFLKFESKSESMSCATHTKNH